MKPPLTDAEISQRAPVWWALSELLLDTEHSSSWLVHLAAVIQASGFSTDEVHSIFRREVAPILYTNGLSATGEWEGWSEAYVKKVVVAGLSRGWVSREMNYALSALVRPEEIWRDFVPYLGDRARSGDEEAKA